jgi:hypothetical protein
MMERNLFVLKNIMSIVNVKENARSQRLAECVECPMTWRRSPRLEKQIILLAGNDLCSTLIIMCTGFCWTLIIYSNALFL